MARPLVALISLFFLAGSIVLQFFVILSGGINSSPENLIWFLQVDTRGIPNARNPSRWTFWSICGVNFFNGLNQNCGSPVAALPFSPPHRTNFDTTFGVPHVFLTTRKFYYLSRFAWVFFLLALLFSVFAFLTGALALCTRIGAYLSGFNTFIALFWQTVAAALMTTWTVQGRNAFRRAGHRATLGQYAYGFVWATVCTLFISTVTFCLAGSSSSSRRRRETTTPAARRGYFRRSRSVRSRKEEYA